MAGGGAEAKASLVKKNRVVFHSEDPIGNGNAACTARPLPTLQCMKKLRWSTQLLGRLQNTDPRR